MSITIELARAYKQGQGMDPDQKQKLRQTWLWGVDCNALGIEACGGMSLSQTLGLLYTCTLEPSPQTVTDLLPNMPLLHLHVGPMQGLSPRELMEQLQCLQLAWTQVLSHTDHSVAQQILDAVASRVGALAQLAFEEGHASVEDCMEHMVELPTERPQNKFFILSRKTIRYLLSLLLALYRTLHIVSTATACPEITEERRCALVQALKQHHLEASVDFWSVLQQMIQVAPGMRLSYRTEFAGMYNDISQVVYFHYPDFARKPQPPLEHIPKSAIHTLPLILQLLPDIPVAYDDDTEIAGLTTAAEATTKWQWLVCCGAIFLASQEERRVYASADSTLLPLVDLLLTKTGRTFVVENEQANPLPKLASTAYSHVSLR